MRRTAFVAMVVDQLDEMVNSGILFGWEFKAITKRNLQRLYSSPERCSLQSHQNRSVKEQSYKLYIYTLGENDSVGCSTFQLVEFRPIQEQIDDAIELAAYSFNSVWELAEPPEILPPIVETCDPKVRETPGPVVHSIEKRFVKAFADTDGCALNSVEIFINFRSTSVFNSKGNAFLVERSDLYLEAAMEKVDSINDKEVHENITSVTVEDLEVEKFVERCSLQVSMLSTSEEPITNLNAFILIGKQPLAELFSSLTKQLACAAEYFKYPHLKVGELVGGGNGDNLTLSVDPTIPRLAQSGAYTRDGLLSKAGSLIKDNMVVNRIVDNRYGQYLNLKPNGLMGNIIVKGGSLDDEKLQGIEYIEIIKFSSLLIDEKKLTWSSEIKLGKHIKPGHPDKLIKGGVVSGRLLDNLHDCFLSKKISTVNFPGDSYTPPLGYQGPDSALLMNGVSISGKEIN
ncbi:metallopeptidase TldD-related protein [Desulfosarcina sp.]|nr:metallopeptidase TldD-related protein [Desulfosarcina sp.]